MQAQPLRCFTLTLCSSVTCTRPRMRPLYLHATPPSRPIHGSVPYSILPLPSYRSVHPVFATPFKIPCADISHTANAPAAHPILPSPSYRSLNRVFPIPPTVRLLTSPRPLLRPATHRCPYPLTLPSLPSPCTRDLYTVAPSRLIPPYPALGFRCAHSTYTLHHPPTLSVEPFPTPSCPYPPTAPCTQSFGLRSPSVC